MPELTKPLIDPDKTLKEGVFGTNEIESKTELSSMQIEAVNKLKTLSVCFGNELLDNHLGDFMTLQKSKDRKSLGEFIEGFKSKKDEYMRKAKEFALFG